MDWHQQKFVKIGLKLRHVLSYGILHMYVHLNIDMRIIFRDLRTNTPSLHSTHSEIEGIGLAAISFRNVAKRLYAYFRERRGVSFAISIFIRSLKNWWYIMMLSSALESETMNESLFLDFFRFVRPNLFSAMIEISAIILRI